jgi:hypothetical protein
MFFLSFLSFVYGVGQSRRFTPYEPRVPPPSICGKSKRRCYGCKDPVGVLWARLLVGTAHSKIADAVAPFNIANERFGASSAALQGAPVRNTSLQRLTDGTSLFSCAVGFRSGRAFVSEQGVLFQILELFCFDLCMLLAWLQDGLSACSLVFWCLVMPFNLLQLRVKQRSCNLVPRIYVWFGVDACGFRERCSGCCAKCGLETPFSLWCSYTPDKHFGASLVGAPIVLTWRRFAPHATASSCPVADSNQSFALEDPAAAFTSSCDEPLNDRGKGDHCSNESTNRE